MEWLEILKNFYKEKPFTYKYSNDEFKVFVAVFLSTRTKDKITENVCDNLFKVVHSFEDLVNIPIEDLEKLIKPVGFHKVKARNLKKVSEILVSKYNSKLPDYDKLLKLPGVGVKVASVVYNVLGRDPKIAVDTHVHRIVNRLGIVSTKNPNETMRELEKKIPKNLWSDINSLLVIHGQKICKPVVPLCDQCPIKDYCKRYQDFNSLNVVLETYKFKELMDLEQVKNKYGTYILFIKLDKNIKIKFSKNKEKTFKKGFYIYVGSAKGSPISLYQRIKRHLSNKKKKHWHIDYLLDYGKIKKIYYTNEVVECIVAKDLIKKGLRFVHGFGCCDCRCPSHLFFIDE